MDLEQIVTVPSNRTMLFYSGMTRCFDPKRPSSGHHYKNFNIRYKALQVMLVYGVPYDLQKLYSKKGKAIPLQAWTGPEGSRRLRLPDFKTIGT
jgi:hypothetical protein